MKGIIYKATNLYNGLSYIGQTRATLEKRRSQHLNDAVTDSVNHFHLALMQYGESGFKWEILDEFSGSKEEVIHALNVAEEYHILRLKTRLSEYGYNATQGGYSSDKFDDAIKKRALANYGGKAVLQYDLDGNFVREYESIAEVCRAFGIKNKHKGCNFLGRKWKGYQWREKVNEYFPRTISTWRNATRKGSCTPIVVYNSNGVYYKSYASIKECWKDLGYHCKIRESFGDVALYAHHRGYLAFKDTGNHPESILVDIIKPLPKREKIDCRVGVVQYDRDGNFIAEFASISEAHRATGCGKRSIGSSVKKELPYKVGLCFKSEYIWRYKSRKVAEKIDVIKEEKAEPSKKSLKEHRIVQYDREGKMLRIWDSVSSIVNSGITTRAIIERSIRGKSMHYDKYQWKRYTNNMGTLITPINDKAPTNRQKAKCSKEHRVLQYGKDGVLIKVWDNMYQASLQTGESHTLIRKQCMNLPTKKKTASIWKYYTPDYAQTIEVA